MTGEEIDFLRPEVVGDGVDNGGPPTSLPWCSGGLWPRVSAAERVAGSVVRRKVFIHVRDQGGTGHRLRVSLDDVPVPGGDRLWLCPGASWDREGQREFERRYGVALLAVAAGVGDRVLVIRWPEEVVEAWQPGDLVRVWEPGGQREAWFTLEGVFSSAGMLRLSLAGSLRQEFSRESRVSGVWETGAVVAWSGEWSVWSRLGRYVVRQGWRGGVVLDSVGCIAERWRLTFLSATRFQCHGERVGLVGEGETREVFVPCDQATGLPYFQLAPGGWGGRWRAGEGVCFTTLPPVVGVWLTREILPGGVVLPGRRPALNVVCLKS